MFTGTVVGAELATLYASADAFVFLSGTETFGNVVIEAQASGLPVIVAERGATSEHVVDGTTGFALDPRDHDGVRRAMARLIREPELRSRMGKAAVSHAATYEVGAALRGTFRCYARILAELRPRPVTTAPGRRPRLAQAVVP